DGRDPAYTVAHSACHAARNALGASGAALTLDGGMIPMQNWYAPSLLPSTGAGLQQWAPMEMAQMLQTGASTRGSAAGPMAQVVLHSTQYLRPVDIAAMAQYLGALPDETGAQVALGIAAGDSGAASEEGAKLYEKHCAQCHGAAGQGIVGAYAALAGSRAVTRDSPVNLVQMVLNGGFPPATQGNPRPFGMPPFALILSDHDVAAVLSHVRNSWGNRASDVAAHDVDLLRGNAR
ncbi:MAG: cytochrome c, partial [Betaproteobacteria bacterium]